MKYWDVPLLKKTVTTTTTSNACWYLLCKGLYVSQGQSVAPKQCTAAYLPRNSEIDTRVETLLRVKNTREAVCSGGGGGGGKVL